MKKTPKAPKGPAVLETYETEIEYMCPVRGKVKQKVKVKRMEAAKPNLAEEVRPVNDLAEQLDKKFSGLFLADDTVDEGEEVS